MAVASSLSTTISLVPVRQASFSTSAKPSVPSRKLSLSAIGGKLTFEADSYSSYTRPLTRLRSSLKDSPATTTQEKITLTNNSGEKLVGILQDAGSNDVAILCHGFRCTKDLKPLPYLADELAAGGISSFRFDFSGNGESEGTWEYGNYYKEVEDLRTVVLSFREKGRDVTAILGHGKGANVVLLYAGKYQDVNTFVSLAARCNMAGGIAKRLGEDYMEKATRDGYLEVKDKNGNMYKVTAESLKERVGIDMKAVCTSINENIRVLTVHGTKDPTIPQTEPLEISKLIKNHRLEFIEGADHRCSEHLSDLSGFVVPFIKSGLKA